MVGFAFAFAVAVGFVVAVAFAFGVARPPTTLRFMQRFPKPLSRPGDLD